MCALFAHLFVRHQSKYILRANVYVYRTRERIQVKIISVRLSRAEAIFQERDGEREIVKIDLHFQEITRSSASTTEASFYTARGDADDRENRRAWWSSEHSAHLCAFRRAPRLITVNHRTPCALGTSVNCHSARLVDH